MYYIPLGPNKSYKILLRTTNYYKVFGCTTKNYYPVLQNTTKNTHPTHANAGAQSHPPNRREASMARGWYHVIFIEKHKELAGWSSVTYKFTVKMKPRRNLYGIHNDFSAVAGVLIRNRDGVVRLTFLELAHMLDVAQLYLPCPCKHVGSYASHGVGMLTFIGLAHILDAAQLCLFCRDPHP